MELVLAKCPPDDEIGLESEQIPNGLKLQLSLCGNVCGGRPSLIDNCNTADLSETGSGWICRIGSREILGISREVSLAYREEIGHSLFPPQSDILISSWRASQISIKLTKIRPEKEKAECIGIGRGSR